MEKIKIFKSDENIKILQGAIVCGRVKYGKGCSVWFNAVVRGDHGDIVMGNLCNIQDNAVLHVEEEKPIFLGNGVTVGHGAIVHSATVGDNTIVGMGAILITGAVVGKNCMIGAGAVVTGKSVIPDNSLVLGNPAKVIRSLTKEELDIVQSAGLRYLELSKMW